jgi:tRNA pseudouridine-54 N-methylase
MLNSHKLLYILPDVAYIAELLPTKKEHTFTVQTFRQINGEFIDDNDFIAENIKKLIGKLDPEEYHLILPDFLFTNTIVEVNETDESKVIKFLKEKLLPELTLSPETHELKTFVLTNHGGKSKVQLSALEKSLMNPISQNVEEKGVKIKAISPLSWTLKSIISLEPSISILQMGSHVYLTQHYIGIDQAMSATVDDVANLSETIKTLKGAEPSIQTVYLIANQLVEEKLKENLSDTLPLQQLANFSEDDTEMPSYVKFGIEAGMKTLSLDAFPVPKFPLPKPTEAVKIAAADPKLDVEDDDDSGTTDSDIDEPDTPDEEMKLTDAEESSDLPKPAAAPVVETALVATTITAATTVSAPLNELSLDDDNLSPVEETPEPTTAVPEEKASTATEDESSKDKEAEEEKIVPPMAPMKKEVTKEDTKKSDVIKNQSGLQPMLKMLGISFLVFLITVGVGVGVGRAFIYFTQQGNLTTETPIASVTPLPSEEPTPSPSPSPVAEIDVSELSILVVNATTKAGYAGATKDALDDADFGTVTAGNAKGDYEPDGTIVLMEEENTALLNLLEKTLDTTLTFEEGTDIEDAQGKYDAIIVLTE